jgi:pyruvate dehydrogenase E2 component (dihydrolipoamide acetyltransferase)
MGYEFRLPDIGEGVAQGEVVKWHVKVGDTVQEDQPLVSVLTDKANVEIPCPVKGKVLSISAKEGEIVKVGGLLITFEAEGGATPSRTEGHGAPAPTAPAAAPTPAAPAGGNDRVITTPAIRRRANELGVDLRQVRGTGPGGRVTDADLLSFAKGGTAAAPVVAPVAPSRPADAAPAPARIPPAPVPVPVSPSQAPLQERIPLRGLRRVIAEHMSLSKSHAAHYTYVEELNVSELVRVREKAKKKFEERGVPLTYLAFITKAVVESLKDHPRVNALMDDEKGELVVCHYYNIGIAAATPDGLIVPVIKDADKKSIATIAKEIEDLSTRGRVGKLTREELTGSTFTISSLGALGGLLATPILNYPEVAILGVHKIERRPVVLPDGGFGVAHMMNLSISLDHRAIDGYDGAQFIASVKARLEDPHQLLLELK